MNFEEAKQQIAEKYGKTDWHDLSCNFNIAGKSYNMVEAEADELWQSENLKEIEQLKEEVCGWQDVNTILNEYKIKNSNLQNRIAELEAGLSILFKNNMVRYEEDSPIWNQTIDGVKQLLK